ncbi:MAG: dihydroorotase [Acidobacteria bacterium]|nr:MAG: dihydroorotase [Acidobacteriota bacterium]
MTRLLVRRARIVDPSQELDEIGDLLLEDGIVKAIGALAVAEDVDVDVDVIDADGLVATPGFIDMHVHLREPGFEYKETIATGCRAAVAGGFTAVAAMANTDPPNDSAAVTEFILRKAAQADAARVYPIGTITKGMKGEQLSEMGEMVEAGVVAVSDDGLPVRDPNVMRRAMEYATVFDVPVIEHCETPELHPKGVMNEGYWSTALGLFGIPRASEIISVDRNVVLAELTGARFHVAHLSTSGALRRVREAKARGLAVTCEVTPHHLVLTDESLKSYNTDAKMKPPLVTEEDRNALLEGLADKTVDAIATDHAPHHADEKREDFDHAPFGIVGLETAVSLCLDRLVKRGVISLSRMVELLSSGPARVLGVAGGTLKVGSPADVTLLDLTRQVRVDPESFRSRGKNTPFAGWELEGGPVTTIVGGRVAWTLE